MDGQRNSIINERLGEELMIPGVTEKPNWMVWTREEDVAWDSAPSLLRMVPLKTRIFRERKRKKTME